MSDESLRPKLNFRILEFYTKPKERTEGDVVVDEKTGMPVMEDWVRTCPIGQADRTATPHLIRRISKIDNRNVDNPGYRMAYDFWQAIKPHYETWKRGEEVPIEGTPLAVASFLTKEAIEAIKKAGIRTLEEFVELNDSTRDRINMPRAREAQAQAKRVLDAKDQNAAAAKIDAQAGELAALKAQMAELIAAQANAVLAEPKRGPGRPRKEQEAA